jgi:cell division protein FtsA
VLAGGGAQLPGAAELASNIFNLPVRIGVPLSAGGLVEEYRSPAFATAVGLMLEGYDREERKNPERGAEIKPRDKAPLFGRFTDWIRKEFF